VRGSAVEVGPLLVSVSLATIATTPRLVRWLAQNGRLEGHEEVP